MNFPALGSLCHLVDDFGRNCGVCLLVDIIEPNSRDIPASNLWNYEIIHEGKLKILQTGFHTLIPIEQE